MASRHTAIKVDLFQSKGCFDSIIEIHAFCAKGHIVFVTKVSFGCISNAWEQHVMFFKKFTKTNLPDHLLLFMKLIFVFASLLSLTPRTLGGSTEDDCPISRPEMIKVGEMRL